MFENMSAIEIIKLFAPVIVIQLGLLVYCITSILKNGVRNLNKGIWIAIVLILNMIGPVLYLLLGKKRWEDD